MSIGTRNPINISNAEVDVLGQMYGDEFAKTLGLSKMAKTIYKTAFYVGYRQAAADFIGQGEVFSQGVLEDYRNANNKEKANETEHPKSK